MERKAELTKKEIRKAILEKRAQLTEEERARAAMVLADRIIGHQWFYRSDTLLAFASYGTEIDTREIIEEALKKQKKVYLPGIHGDRMEFYRISSLEDLREGYKGIPEPSASMEPYLYDENEADHTLMLMPGVVFDPYRNRIGYGKGFYDRFLEEKQALQCRTIAVGFRCQQVEQIPAQEYDIKPYQVILV